MGPGLRRDLILSGEGVEGFEPGGPAVARELAAHDAGTRDPVELDRTPLADMRVMSVKRIFAAAEGHHRAGDGRDLGGKIFEIVAAAQQTKAPRFLFPHRV